MDRVPSVHAGRRRHLLKAPGFLLKTKAPNICCPLGLTYHKVKGGGKDPSGQSKDEITPPSLREEVVVISY